MKKASVFRLRLSKWQGWRDSNSQHADLESAALPIGATPLEIGNQIVDGLGDSMGLASKLPTRAISQTLGSLPLY